MHKCIDDELLVRLAAGLVPHAQAERIVVEVESCELCRSLLIEAGMAVAQLAPNLDAVFRPGDLVAQRFEVRRLIGRGGMGEVFEVFDRELQDRIALKTIRPELNTDASIVSRFKQELRLARQVVHRNVCRVFDFGVLSSNTAEATHYYTMELISGQPLSAFRRTPEATFELRVNVAHQMASALQAIHALGIVHRDFKPENVMICPTSGAVPRAVLLDFGIARSPDRIAGLQTTGIGVRLGTPDYMAPEVLHSNLPSPASDVYSFGLTLFELFAGRHPSPHAGTRMALSALGELEIPRLDVELGAFPRQLADLVADCLATTPARRPADGAQLVRRIAALGLLNSHTEH